MLKKLEDLQCPLAARDFRSFYHFKYKCRLILKKLIYVEEAWSRF